MELNWPAVRAGCLEIGNTVIPALPRHPHGRGRP